jgi:co-chaperonin GroES (HSP10)
MAYKKIQPTGQKLIVLPLEKKEEKVDSLYIPETANASLSEGVVVEVGDAVSGLYKKGDKIIFPSGAGVGMMYEGKPHLWLDGGDSKTLSQVWGIIGKD